MLPKSLLARTYLVWGDNPLTAEQVQAIATTQQDPQFTKNDARLQKAVEYADKVIRAVDWTSTLTITEALWT